MDREFGVGRCKLLSLGWISNETLLHSTGTYIQSLGVEDDGRWHDYTFFFFSFGLFCHFLGHSHGIWRFPG